MKYEFTWREKTMFNKKSSFVPAALILASFVGVSAANAQDTACPYTLASLQGSYAIVTNYGANIAMALATRSLDGNGNLSGTFLGSIAESMGRIGGSSGGIPG